MSQDLIIPQIGLKALIEVREHINNNDYMFLRMGICACFDSTDVMEGKPYFLSDYMSQAGIDWRNWPKYSGMERYPVPCTNEYGETVNPLSAYGVYSKYWDNNVYGNNRKDLLNWLIYQFEQVVEKSKEIV